MVFVRTGEKSMKESDSNMASTDETDDSDVAFKVLNNDNLPISVVGESILRPFGREHQKDKPNVVVYPTRRVTAQLEDNRQKPFARSQGYINNIPEGRNQQQLKKKYSNSYGNLNHCNSASKTRLDVVQNQTLDKIFTRTLDAKLKRLQKEEKQKPKKMDIQNRPLFMTTVKKGLFLEPPREAPNSLAAKNEETQRREKRKVYEFSSKPRVINKVSNVNGAVKLGHKARCEAAAKAAAIVASTVAGIQHNQEKKKDYNGNVPDKSGDAYLPYSNLMFDRRISRGSNYALHAPVQTGEGESAAARAAEARRRAMARRKAQAQQIRGAQLRLKSPPPVPGRRHEEIQTDTYLEELMNDPPAVDMYTQTDLFLDRPRSPFYVPAKTGIDAETQIYPGDLFDFDMEVQPILEVLVAKTIEQALIEVLEEEELAALREQQRRFLEIRASECSEVQRLEEREMRWKAEKEKRFLEYAEGMEVQKEMEERIAASVLMQGYMADLLPSVLEGLEEDGFLADNIKQEVDESFMPWLMKEVTQELQDIVTSRDVLTDLVREILQTRAELYKALNEEKLAEIPDGEEGPTTMDDIFLEEHLKLKSQIADKLPPENPQ